MILTVTLNPSVDISYHLNTLQLDDVNRVETVTKTAGGKGLNVSRVAHELGAEVLATGILGGTIGTYITQQLQKQQIGNDFFQIKQESRNCIAILHEGKQTEILEAGPELSAQEGTEFVKHFQTILEKQEPAVLTISGSLPKGLSPDIYKQIIKRANEKSIPVVLDTSGSTLAAILDDPTLKITAIKPNLDELTAIEQCEQTTDLQKWKVILESSRYQNIDWIIISLGANGAFAKHGDQFYQVNIPPIKVVSPVGSGDATVAGIAYSLENGYSEDKLLKTAMTTGMLNTMEVQTGHINPDHFAEWFAKVTISEI